MKEAPRSRQATKTVLRGGHVAGIIRGDWGKPSEQPPLLDEPARYPKKKKGRDRKPKERCPARTDGHHTHEWMKDTEEIPVLKTSWVTEKYSPTMAEIVGREYWTRHKTEQVGTTEVLYRLCAHCGKTQFKNGNRRWGRWTDHDRGYREAYRSYNGKIRIY